MSVLSVILGLNANRFRSGFAGAASYAQRFGTALRGAMLTALGPIALAMSAINFLKETFQDANKVADLSERYKVSEEALQRLAAVGKRVGLEMEDVARLLKDLNKAMAQGIADPKKAALFARLGISAEELRDGTVSATDAVFRISQALDGTANKTEILLMLYDLLGRSGETLATILNKSDQEIQRIFNNASVLSAEQVQAADNLGDAFDDAAEVMKVVGMWIITFLGMIGGVIAEIGVGIFQIFVNMTEGTTMMLKKAAGFMASILEAIGFDWAANMASTMRDVYGEIEKAAEDLDSSLDEKRAKIKAFTDQMVAGTFGFRRESEKASREGRGLDTEMIQKQTGRARTIQADAIQVVGGGGIASGPSVQAQALDVARRQLEEQRRTNQILSGKAPAEGSPATTGGSPSGGDDIFDIFNFNPKP